MMIRSSFPELPMPWDARNRQFAADQLQAIVYGSPGKVEAIRSSCREVSAYREIWSLPFPVLCATPTGEGPWPTLFGLNFDGIHSLETDPLLPEPVGPVGAAKVGRGSRYGSWPLDRITKAGWAVLTAFVGDIEPDDPKLSRGNAVSRWAHGIQSIAHAAARDARFDRNRFVALGHSRLGKAALLAGAIDDRLAGVIGIQSGCGGAAPSRTLTGETIADITGAFPHWFAPSFGEYAGREQDLPLDQHWLLALCASRPVLLANATEDTWANPHGQHEMLRLAAEIHGESLPDLTVNETVGGRLAHFCRNGGHEVTAEDWSAILAWLEGQFP